MSVLVLANQKELIYISSVRTQDVVQKTCRERWMTGIDGERETETETEKKRERVREIRAVSVT